MIRTVARKVVIVLAVMLAVMTLSANAALANHWPLCSGSSGWFCVYKNTGGHDGGVRLYSGNDNNYDGENFDRCYVNCAVNDETSSLWNRESYTVRSFVHMYTGAYFDSVTNQKRTSMLAGFNDALSSHKGV